MDPSVLKRSNLPAITGADRIRPIGYPSVKRINRNNWMSGNACNADSDYSESGKGKESWRSLPSWQLLLCTPSRHDKCNAPHNICNIFL